jgi:hypothetical protein
VIGIRISLQLWRRCQRSWRQRLGREGAGIALLALLTLGLFEPLACVLHCALWMPLHMQSTQVVQAQHQHHHTVTHSDVDASSSTAVSMPALDQTLGHDQVSCIAMANQSGHDSSSHHPPLAQPFHEMAFMVAGLAILLLIQRYTALTVYPPLLQSLLPLLRPPIA